MMWIDLVAVLALLQFLGFGVLVGQARGRYGVHAPAVTGHEAFERLYRVQMNTLELLVLLLPSLYIAARYWSPGMVAGVGSLYLIGRLVYWQAYVKDPALRTFGFALSFLPIVGLLVAALLGLARSLL